MMDRIGVIAQLLLNVGLITQLIFHNTKISKLENDLIDLRGVVAGNR
jgi:hypothetical protein